MITPPIYPSRNQSKIRLGLITSSQLHSTHSTPGQGGLLHMLLWPYIPNSFATLSGTPALRQNANRVKDTFMPTYATTGKHKLNYKKYIYIYTKSNTKLQQGKHNRSWFSVVCLFVFICILTFSKNRGLSRLRLDAKSVSSSFWHNIRKVECLNFYFFFFIGRIQALSDNGGVFIFFPIYVFVLSFI